MLASELMNRLTCWLAGFLASSCALSAASQLVYIGTGSRGIYALRLDSADGTLSAPMLAADDRDPGFLALDPSKRRLYAVDEIPPALSAKANAGGVSAFAVDRVSGSLTLLNQRPSGDGPPPHLVVDATGKMLIAADYGAGTICAWPIESDGSLGERSALIEHRGRPGPNRDRQSRPHPHSVTLSPDNRFAFVCDLGLDRVFAYRIDPSRGALAPNDPPFTVVRAGAGPRHSKFSPDGRFFYVVNEMGGSICVFAYDAARGSLSLRQTISTLPPGFRGANTSAEVRIDPRGRFLYASNRGPDTLAVFARDPLHGTLTPVEIVPCGGSQPRNFALSPDGRWLLCANRATNNVVVFRVDPATGRLIQTPNQATIGQPICVLFYEQT